MTSKLPPLVGLYSSSMQSGKSTVAHTLVQHDFRIVRFANPMKAMASELFKAAGYGDNARQQMLYGDLKETSIPELGGKTPRFIMQRLGTEFGRELIADSLWVDLALSYTNTLRSTGIAVVIDDLRFVNEAEALEAAGGVIVKVDRGLTPMEQHASEGALDHWSPTYVIPNFGTLTQLHMQTGAFQAWLHAKSR